MLRLARGRVSIRNQSATFFFKSLQRCAASRLLHWPPQLMGSGSGESETKVRASLTLRFLSPSASHPILLLLSILLPILLLLLPILLPRPSQPPKSLRQASGSLSELSLISLENTLYCDRPRDVSKKESRAFCLFICLFCFVTADQGCSQQLHWCQRL